MNAIGSSLLLIGCFQQSGDAGSQAKADAQMSVKADEKKADAKADEKKETESSGTDFGGDSGSMGESGDPVDESTNGAHDGCEEGEMVFEEACTAKVKVTEIINIREREAVAKVKSAKKPKEQAEAATELLEQQSYQIDKYADDFDEIIEQLKQEQLEQKPLENDEKQRP